MRPPVLDSDDEGDDEVFVSANSNTQASIAGSSNSNGEGTNESTIVNNTNSTELLRQQMLSAERHLLSNSAPMAVSKTLQSSPSLRAQKRRHTAISGSGAATTPEKAVKRLKSLTTYGAEGSSRVADESAFDQLRDGVDGRAPQTSQSARFSEHSGHRSSGELPIGSLGQDFVDHEPAIMFRDTGSTVPDGSYTQNRILQQALSSKKGMSSSAVDQVQDEEDKSSSFPWSASEQTANQSKGSVEGDDSAVDKASDANIDCGTNDDAADARDENSGEYAAQVSNNESGDWSLLNEDAGIAINATEESIDVRRASKHLASPIVEISHNATRSTKTSCRDSTSVQKSAKSSKHKSDEANDSEPLNSDDRAVGLPKERYQPRPSRRRSTQIVDEAIDYSVRPEKAAKAKRTKTSVAATDENVQISREHITNLKIDIEKAKTPSKTDNKRSDNKDKTLNQNGEITTVEKPDNDVTNNSEQIPTKTGSQTAETTPTSSSKPKDEHVFKKPALPVPKPKSTSLSRRSRTTIFEDHVEFAASEKSPTLSQQQEARKSARKDIHTDTAKSTKRKRKAVVEDDDDEDELAKDSDGDREAEKNEPVPTNRGRGRPAKGKPQTKSAERSLEDSEDDGEDEEGDEDEPPKKKRRGRPPKAAAAAKPPAVETEKPTIAWKASDPLPPAQEKSQDSKASGHIIGKENLTPSPSQSPEIPPEKLARTPQKDGKPSPTLHSPIKNSSAVPLRVGLSSRRRIPSLLKMINPPKPRT